MCIKWQYYAIYSIMMQCIAHAILLKCENVCDIDIACPNIARW